LFALLKGNTDKLLNKFKTYNCSSDLIETIIYYCYANCLKEDKEDYLHQLAKNRDALYNIIENIDELDGLKDLLELNKISVDFNEGYFIYN
jgi:hypothetical protein